MLVQEMVRHCDAPYITVYTYCKSHNIKGRKVNDSYGISAEYKDEEAAKVIEYFQSKKQFRETEEKLKTLSKEDRIKELKKLHPLVTDEKCFDINWWPSTMPDCLVNIEA